MYFDGFDGYLLLQAMGLGRGKEQLDVDGIFEGKVATRVEISKISGSGGAIALNVKDGNRSIYKSISILRHNFSTSSWYFSPGYAIYKSFTICI